MKILTFDIESCTGSPSDASLCSFGYCFSEDFEVLEKEDILVNPLPKKFRLGKKGEEARIKLAYEEEEFRRSPRFPKVYNDIKRLFLKADICIGFAVGNDVRYLNNACQIFRLPIIEYRFCDVQMLAGFIDETNKGMGLSRLGEKYGIEFLEHKSDDDAFATLMLFQKLCESCKMGAKELLDYYEIVPGVNAKDGVKGMFSLAQIYNRKGLKRSKAQSGILLHEFLREMKKRPKTQGILRGKRVCFYSELEKDDILTARRLIKRIYDLGGSYTSDLTSANLYVTSGKEGDARLRKVKRLMSAGQRVKIVGEKEFVESLGEVEQIEFDDVSVLVKHAREKAENRMARARGQKGGAEKSKVEKYREKAGANRELAKKG